MKSRNEIKVFWTLVACLTNAAAEIQDVAYMDREIRQGVFYECGDVITDTLSGHISSIIPPNKPNLNCSLTLHSPSGTRLSLTITDIMLATSNVNTCSGNRLKILSRNVEGELSLLPTFPNGLCGYVKPSQPIESMDNQVHLLFEAVESTVQSTFSLNYAAFKTQPDGDCFECEVSSIRNSPFCIDQRLLCDGAKDCPGNTEESDANCAVTVPPPTNGLSITIIVIIIILAVVLLAIIIFVILAIVAKRAHSKRDRDSVRRPQRVSQSRMGSRDANATGQNHRHHRQSTDRQQPHGHHGHGIAPTFTTEGEYRDGVNQGGAPYMEMLPAAPPPYSTLPRPMEQSLQMAEGTTPTSRPRGETIYEDLESP